MDISIEKSKAWSVLRRLQFIDFTLFWDGQINRVDIMERFGISVPQASKDLAAYHAMAPENLEYSLSQKRYFAAKSFNPIFFEPDAEAYLAQMRDDVQSFLNSDDAYKPNLPEHDIVRTPRRHVSTEILKDIVAAIRQKTSCEITYQSMSSDEPEERLISPHALVFDGLRWHARSYCYKREVFRDFLLARILHVENSVLAGVAADADKQWNTYVKISLIPHPGLTKSQAEAVAMDFNMVDGHVQVPMRAAFLYYFLHRLNLSDCDGRKNDPRKQHVVIENPDALRAIYNSTDYPA